MKSFKIQTLTLFLLLCSVFKTNAQFSIPLAQDNFEEVIEFLEINYGEQIEIGLPEVIAYLEELLYSGEISEECRAPEPQISSYDYEHMTFSWEEIPDVEYYETRSLNLNTGESTEDATDVPEKTYYYSEDLYLFAFSSKCIDGKSKFNLIIVDKDVMFQLPPEVWPCDCDNPTPIIFRVSSNPNPTIHTSLFMDWHTDCPVFNKHLMTVNSAGFNANVHIVYNPIPTPDDIYIQKICSNGISNYSNYPGEPGKYRLQFHANGMMINLEDTNISSSNVSTYACACNSIGLRFGEETTESSADRNENITLFNYQNPINETLELSLQITEESEVSLQLYNQLGEIVAEKPRRTDAPGIHRYRIDVAHLPAGLYTAVAKIKDEQRSFIIAKAN